MNKARRKTLAALHGKVDDLRAELYNLVEDLGNEKDAERESFDNMSEGLQASENGQAIERAADALEGAHDTLDNVLAEMQDALDKIDEATEG